MRQINLLPPELAAKKRARQVQGVMAAGGAVLLALLGIVYGAQRARLAAERNKLEEQQRENAGLQRQVSQLSQFSRQQQDLQTKTQLLQAITRTEVRWSAVLTEVSLVIPIDDWLTSFTGVVSQTSGGATTTTGAGTIQVNGCALEHPDGTHLNVAQFLVQMAKPLAFTDDVFLSLSSKADTADCPVNFTFTITLTDAARRASQPGGARRI